LEQFNKVEQEEEVQVVKPKNKLLQEEEDLPEEEHGLTYDERIVNYKIELREIKEIVLSKKRKGYDDVINDNLTI
jgi:hypothetical protein